MEVEMQFPESEPTDYPNSSAFNTHSHMRGELERLGCTVEKLGRFTFVTFEGKSFLTHVSETSFTSLAGFRFFKDKSATNLLLRRNAISVAEQTVFSRQDRSGGLEAVRELGSAVVKPIDGNMGRGVSVGVTEQTFNDAWDAACAATESDSILVESYFRGGSEARYLVVDGRCIAVHRRVPPFVRGDGISSVSKLIERRNAQRLRNPYLMKNKIRMDAQRRYFLSQQGLTLDAIPEAGRVVLIDTKAGLSTGGEAMEITESVDPAMKHIAEKISGLLPGMDVIGIDVLAKDHGRPPASEDYIIVEVNTQPALGGHIYPSYGEPRNVCRSIAESCVRRMKLARAMDVTP